MSAGKKNFLFPTRTDPRNRTCGAISGPLLALELLVLVLSLIIQTAPHTYSEQESRIQWMVLFVVPTILILVGLRGFVSSRKVKVASFSLALVNLLLLGVVVLMYVSMAQG